MANEAFARVKRDQLLKGADWSLKDGRSVCFEYPFDDGGKADYALFDRQCRALDTAAAKAEAMSVALWADVFGRIPTKGEEHG